MISSRAPGAPSVVTTAIPEFTQEAVLEYERASGLVGMGDLLERSGRIRIIRGDSGNGGKNDICATDSWQERQ